MKLQELRDMVASFEGADGDLDVVIPDEETGQIVDFDAVASIMWYDFTKTFVYENKNVSADAPNATKVFILRINQ